MSGEFCMDSSDKSEECTKFIRIETGANCDVTGSEDTQVDENEGYSMWGHLPDLIMEQVLAYLPMNDRFNASMVCRNWNHMAFNLPRVWSYFMVGDETLTRPKFNQYSGWQHVFDYNRAESCLTHVGCNIRHFDFRPFHCFNNMYKFMTLVSWFITQNKNPDCPGRLLGVCTNIRSLTYIFPCNKVISQDPDGVHLFVTGGQLLAALRKLLLVLTQLKTLRLVDLVLERYEAKHLLDEVVQSCTFTMEELTLMNVTLTHCPIMNVGLFFNLRVLTISPQNIDDAVLQLLGDSKIEHLYISQNRYSPNAEFISPCSANGWNRLRRNNPNLLVHLRIESEDNGEIVLQPNAPVYSILYSAPKTSIVPAKLLSIIEMYKSTLSIYGFELLPKFISPKSFPRRVDSLLVQMAHSCTKLGTLIIREKISTSTILLLAVTMSNLKYLHVRRNAVILRCEWPKCADWSKEFYDWLRKSSRSYGKTEKEVSLLLGSKWGMLSDKEFKKLTVDVEHI